jgi:hypothetical protein
MNNAQLIGIRLTAVDYLNGNNYDVTRCTITETKDGYEARRGGKLVGITLTREGAQELLEAL